MTAGRMTAYTGADKFVEVNGGITGGKTRWSFNNLQDLNEVEETDLQNLNAIFNNVETMKVDNFRHKINAVSGTGKETNVNGLIKGGDRIFKFGTGSIVALQNLDDESDL